MDEPAASKPKLLCVDDEEEMLTAASRLLSKDFDVLTTDSPEKALEIIDSNPDLAIFLSDQSMPRMSGMRLLGLVKERLPNAVRALITARLDPNDIAIAINTSRIHRLILKPWDNEYFRLQMLEALAEHSTLREKSVLEKLSITDALTGLKNHRYFHDQIKIEVERALRHNRPLSLFMVDIDHFKAFNDRFGHPAGDALLKTVAQRLLDQVRTLDTVARYGGEEFAIILPDTPFENALPVAERIRLAFERNPYEGPHEERVPLTVSLGVASVPTHTINSADLIAKADAALYQAKGQGRNQTVGA